MQLASIATRLEKLLSESEELGKYRELDGEKRAIEYHILHNDVTEVNAQLAEVRSSLWHTFLRLDFAPSSTTSCTTKSPKSTPSSLRCASACCCQLTAADSNS